MQSIGEKIEEARKRKGISLREAAEATKIRSDFLTHIEKNEFDYDLPSIYKIGFIKNYAKYLKLNPDKIVSQYQDQILAHSKNSKKTSAELFGANIHLDQPTEDPLLDNLTPKPSYGTINVQAQAPTATDDPPNPQASSTQTSNKELYLKTGIVGIGTLLFVFSAIWLIQSIVNSNDRQSTSQLSASASITEESTASDSDSNSVSYPIEEVTLKASGTVYVLVVQKIDDKILLKRNLNEGDIQTLKKRGPIKVAFTNGENLSLITSSLEAPVRPKTDSKGSITLP